MNVLILLLPLAYGLPAWYLAARRTTAMLASQSHPLADPAILAVAAKLARTLDLPSLPVQVFEIDDVNGLAAPDGRIYITRGFLARHAQGGVSADELASVIAHELGHVALGHTQRRLIDFTGQNAVFMMLSMVLGRILPVIGVWIARLVATAIGAGLSRRDEFAADAYASALLIKAGIGTAPQKSLFAKLERLTARAGGPPPLWLASHPPAADRIAAIAANEAKWMA